MRRTTRILAGSAVLAVALTGCSTKASNNGGGGGGSGDIKTDVGVTDDTITLGVMTDLSGVFKPSGVAYTAGNQLWADDVNSRGGICGRDIKLDVQDHGYKPDNAVSLYPTMAQNDLAILQMVGSPILAALKQRITTDNMLTIPASWASENLDSEAVLMIGQTYDVEMINGLDFLMQEGKIAEGDTIGHIYVDSEYGLNAFKGTEYFAEQNEMTVIGAPVASTDSDMTAIMAKMKSEAVTAIAVTTASQATGSVVLQNVAQGLNVPVIGSSPTFSIQLLQNPSTVEAMANLNVVANNDAFGTGTNNPTIDEIEEKYAAAYDDPPDRAITGGYVFGMAMEAVLTQACEDGDLTRAGVLAARKKLDDIDTKGITGNLDFSDPGAPSSREGFIFKIDANAPVGVVIARELYASDDAKKYKTPYQK